MENYYCNLVVHYIKAILYTSIVFGFPNILLLLFYRNNVNNCIIKEVENNVTTVEAVKKCDNLGILFILIVFIQLSIIVIGVSLADDKDFKGIPVKPDNTDLEIDKLV